jgi:O-antigen/teichoic acid export membrane protein
MRRPRFAAEFRERRYPQRAGFENNRWERPGSIIGAKNARPETRVGHLDPAPKISHAVLLTSAQLWRGLVRLLFVIVAARALGPEQFGIYALVLATVEMIAVASGSGYGDYLTREAAKDEPLGWGVAAQLTRLRLLSVIPFTAIGLILLWMFGYSRFALGATAWMALTLVPRSPTEAVQGVLRGIGRYAEFLGVELAFGFALVAGAGVLLWRGGGVRAAVEIELAAAIAAGFAAVIMALKLRTPHRARLSVSQLLKACSIFNIYYFVGNLYDRLDVILLSRLGGNYATGIYGAAYRPIGTFQLVPYGVLYRLLPALSRGDCERERLEKVTGLLLSTAFLIVLATMAFSDGAIRLILGARFAESAAALKILIWAVILRYLNYGLNMGLLAARRERVFVATSLTCLAVNLIGNLVFIPIYSWRAAAVLTVVTELVLLGQNVYWFRRIFGAAPRPFGWAQSSAAFVPLLVVVIMGVKVASPIAVGGGCLLLFVTYLYRTGMLGEFTGAWRAERSTRLASSRTLKLEAPD